jgi:hypothetical protein
LQQPEESVAASKGRQEALQQFIGIWKTEQSPGDEQVERILDQGRIRKYANAHFARLFRQKSKELTGFSASATFIGFRMTSPT